MQNEVTKPHEAEYPCCKTSLLAASLGWPCRAIKSLLTSLYQGIAKRFYRGEALFGLLGECLHDHRLNRLRQRQCLLLQGRWWGLNDLGDDFEWLRTLKQRHSTEPFV